jgi:hypothetical protein
MYNYNNQTDYDACTYAKGFKDVRPLRFRFVGDGSAVYCAFDPWVTVVRIIVSLVGVVIPTFIGLSIVFHKWFILIGSTIVQLVLGVGYIGMFIVDAYYTGRSAAWCDAGLPGADLQGRYAACDNGIYLAIMGIDILFILVLIITSIFALCTSRKKYWMKANDPHRAEILDNQLEDIRNTHKQQREEEEKNKKSGYVWDE